MIGTHLTTEVHLSGSDDWCPTRLVSNTRADIRCQQHTFDTFHTVNVDSSPAFRCVESQPIPASASQWRDVSNNLGTRFWPSYSVSPSSCSPNSIIEPIRCRPRWHDGPLWALCPRPSYNLELCALIILIAGNLKRQYAFFCEISLSLFDCPLSPFPFTHLWNGKMPQILPPFVVICSSFTHLSPTFVPPLLSLSVTVCPPSATLSSCTCDGFLQLFLHFSPMSRPPLGSGAGKDSAGEEQGAGGLPAADVHHQWRASAGDWGMNK